MFKKPEKTKDLINKIYEDGDVAKAFEALRNSMQVFIHFTTAISLFPTKDMDEQALREEIAELKEIVNGLLETTFELCKESGLPVGKIDLPAEM